MVNSSWSAKDLNLKCMYPLLDGAVYEPVPFVTDYSAVVPDNVLGELCGGPRHWMLKAPLPLQILTEICPLN